jgi:hypothetical protein
MKIGIEVLMDWVELAQRTYRVLSPAGLQQLPAVFPTQN